MSTLAIPHTSTTTWNIDPAHTTAEFKVKHMMIAYVKGQFSKVTGVLIYDESDPTQSRVEATIAAASIETRELHVTCTSRARTSLT
jgi:polyisoprenoid-binding protein YceI